MNTKLPMQRIWDKGNLGFEIITRLKLVFTSLKLCFIYFSHTTLSPSFLFYPQGRILYRIFTPRWKTLFIDLFFYDDEIRVRTPVDIWPSFSKAFVYIRYIYIPMIFGDTRKLPIQTFFRFYLVNLIYCLLLKTVSIFSIFRHWSLKIFLWLFSFKFCMHPIKNE